MPATYDHLLGPVLFVPFADLLAAEAAATGSGVTRELELAAGTGILTARLAARMPEASLRATDRNPAMVEYGRRQVPQADWQVVDARNLPFPDGTFDLVACGFGVMFFDRMKAFPEIRRVLSEGGRFLFSTWDRIENSVLPSAFEYSVAAVLPDDTPDFLERIPHGYFDPETIRADLERSGLAGVELRQETVTSHTASARSFAEGLCLGSPLRFGLEQRGNLRQLTASISERMEAVLGTGPVEGPLAAWLVQARR